MGIHLADQTIVFLLSCAIGMLLGLLYDVFRISRVAVNTAAGVVLVEDVVYFLICAVVTFLFLLSANDGSVRFFLFLGEALGWILYYFTIGSLVMNVSRTIIAAVKAILRFVLRYILYPIWRLIYNIISLLCMPFVFLSRLFKKFSQKLKFRLKVRRVLLYNHFTGYFKSRIRKKREQQAYDAQTKEP